MINRKNIATLTIALAAALCGYVSSASALKQKILDTNPNTSNPNYISGVIDQQSGGPDWVMANMFVGNWFGYEVALTDITGVYGGAPASHYTTLVNCSNGRSYTTGTVALNQPVDGAEGAAFCPAGTTAVGSIQSISYN